jgi:hypothetical protein
VMLAPGEVWGLARGAMNLFASAIMLVRYVRGHPF